MRKKLNIKKIFKALDKMEEAQKYEDNLFKNKKMKTKHTIGIDIGLKGGMSLINEKGKLLSCLPMPTIEVLVGKRIRNQYDIPAIYKELSRWAKTGYVEIAGFERLRAIPHQSSQTAFSMGGGSMLFKTLFTVLGIQYVEIEPREWQKSVFKKLGIQYTKKTTKKASIQAAKRLFPEESFLATEQSRKASDGMTDSACIAYYLI